MSYLLALKLKGPGQSCAKAHDVFAEASVGDLFETPLAVEFFKYERPVSVHICTSQEYLFDSLVFRSLVAACRFGILFLEALYDLGCIFYIQFFDVFYIPHLILGKFEVRDLL